MNGVRNGVQRRCRNAIAVSWVTSKDTVRAIRAIGAAVQSMPEDDPERIALLREAQGWQDALVAELEGSD